MVCNTQYIKEYCVLKYVFFTYLPVDLTVHIEVYILYDKYWSTHIKV